MLMPISLMKILSRLSRAENVFRLSPPSHRDKILRACPRMNRIYEKGETMSSNPDRGKPAYFFLFRTLFFH
jgi:hypothetical protein